MRWSPRFWSRHGCFLGGPNLREPAFGLCGLLRPRMPVTAEQHHQACRRGGVVEAYAAVRRILGRLTARGRGPRERVLGETGGRGIPPVERTGRGLEQIDGVGWN